MSYLFVFSCGTFLVYINNNYYIHFYLLMIKDNSNKIHNQRGFKKNTSRVVHETNKNDIWETFNTFSIKIPVGK